MREMLIKYDYVQSMLSKNMRFLIGRLTEHFLPDDLFEEILNQVTSSGQADIDMDFVWNVHRLTQTVLHESQIKIMIYESAFTEFSVLGEVDFFNYKVNLTTDQRCRCLRYVSSLIEEQKNLSIKMIRGRFVTDFQYSATPCLFLTDTISYMRLGTQSLNNNIIVLSADVGKKLFNKFYAEIWEYDQDIVIKDRTVIQDTLEHVLQMVDLLHKSKDI